MVEAYNGFKSSTGLKFDNAIDAWREELREWLKLNGSGNDAIAVAIAKSATGDALDQLAHIVNELRNRTMTRIEPTFTLRASDPDAGRVVRNWASMLESEIQRGARPATDMPKVRGARQIARDMDNWLTAPSDTDQPTLFHGIRQENDEYACACGARWDVSDGDEHP